MLALGQPSRPRRLMEATKWSRSLATSKRSGPGGAGLERNAATVRTPGRRCAWRQPEDGTVGTSGTGLRAADKS